MAGISGYAVAGGLELALLCDFRVMEETAVMGLYGRRFGEVLHQLKVFYDIYYSLIFLYLFSSYCLVNIFTKSLFLQILLLK